MDFLANIVAQILMEFLIYRHAKDKVMWVSLFLRSLLTLQMIFMLATLVFTIYECWVGITDKNFTQFMGDFFKFHFVTVQPWAILGISFCVLAFALTCLYHSCEHRKFTLIKKRQARNTKKKTATTS